MNFLYSGNFFENYEREGIRLYTEEEYRKIKQKENRDGKYCN